ncbi:hypothetical protein VNI00_019314 [Paramarasmius palmivorus]|uniref:Uncharacterized protein n=1 Tax=Paramarasmius palmivorus TaxID=297713 RepID=A0AAW0AP43_9AGAR
MKDSCPPKHRKAKSKRGEPLNASPIPSPPLQALSTPSIEHSPSAASHADYTPSQLHFSFGSGTQPSHPDSSGYLCPTPSALHPPSLPTTEHITPDSSWYHFPPPATFPNTPYSTLQTTELTESALYKDLPIHVHTPTTFVSHMS